MENEEDICVGESHIFFQNWDGVFLGGGKNEKGQLGNGNQNNQSTAQESKILNQHNFVSIKCGGIHSLFLSNNGKVFGTGNSFALGNYTHETTVKTIKEIEFFKNKHIKHIYCGYSSSFFQSNTKLYCSGRNTDGELGADSDEERIYEPTEVLLPFSNNKNEKVIDIKGGYNHTLLLTNQGNVFSTGYGNSGALGHGTKESLKYFKEIQYFKKNKIKISQICCGDEFSLFLTRNGRAYSCGYGEFGQTGLNDKESKLFPSLITHISNIKKIRCGGYSSFFVLKDNSICACGSNWFSQIPPTVFKIKMKEILVPIKISPEFGFIDVFCGYKTTYFVDKHGSIFSIGSNHFGECCCGNFDRIISKPKKIKGIKMKMGTQNDLKIQLGMNQRKQRIVDIIIQTKS